VEDRPHLCGSHAESLEVAMLEVDTGPIGSDDLEANLDLGDEVRVELEVRRDLPS
jgi:hypothetical protein